MTNHLVAQEHYKKYYPTHRVLSFVSRNRHYTKGQKLALEQLLPQIGVEYQLKPVEFYDIFGCDAPVVLEIGFGMGSSLIDMAKSNSKKNFLGIEVYRPGVGACLIRARAECVTNLRLICHDAVAVLETMVSSKTLDTVQLFFPDPWQKRRHNKRRIVQISFAKLVLTKLKLGGVFHIATDCKSYADHMLMVINSIYGYKNRSDNGDWIQRPAFRPYTKFEKKGEQLGHKVWDLMFERVI
ncbi:tRNA (guanosine(46)-N7)-methyltransferase TrmB [Candidatus Erwinia haradaeae]|uniref:tRNA (guanine-N(7)-)-methyltransferase n=1 Tax=Candidatus Erwinia haradaeae TaxID=1922217 RepID=A0A451DKE3_9GAMM|nr:tRNA (guanosine(46)-N7)-methyltransferase TrmB [Candidatus Erwinia haradaeae]VFP87194.1 tRNA (guanine-N(7)-)-methyltransferase [Candidatus Erwinia haradaeae]